MTDPAHHIPSLLFLESFNSHQSHSRWRYWSTNTFLASVSAIGMDEITRIVTPSGCAGCPETIGGKTINCADCPVTITTTFTPPTTCFDNWTPVTTFPDEMSPEAPYISFTQNSTKAECVPSGLASCISYCEKSGFFGNCPSGWSAASVGIVEGATTNYCCPSWVLQSSYKDTLMR